MGEPMMKTEEMVRGLTRTGGASVSAGQVKAGMCFIQAAQRLSHFYELVAFLTSRDPDEYLRDAYATGHPPLTDPYDVRTKVVGDNALTNERPEK